MQILTCKCLMVSLQKLTKQREMLKLARRPSRSDSTLYKQQLLTRKPLTNLSRHSLSQMRKMKPAKSEDLAKITSTVMQQIQRISINTTSLSSISVETALLVKRGKSCSKRTQNSGLRLMYMMEAEQSSLARVILKEDSNSLLMVKLLPSRFSRNRASTPNLQEES